MLPFIFLFKKLKGKLTIFQGLARLAQQISLKLKLKD